MKLTFLVVAFPLFASGCASTLPEVVASAGYPDPVDPKPWRGLNDAQAPKGGA